MINTIATLIASLVGFSGLIIALVNRKESKARANLDIAKADTEGATAANVIIGASNTVVRMLENQINAMQKEMVVLKKDLDRFIESEKHCQSRLSLLERKFRRLLDIAQIAPDDPRLM